MNIFKLIKVFLFVALLFAATGCDYTNERNISGNRHIAADIVVDLSLSADSLEQILKTQTLSPAMQARILSELYRNFAQKDTSIAFGYVHQLCRLENAFFDSLTNAVFYNTLGLFYMKKDSLQKAVDMYDRALLFLSNDNSIPAQDEQAKILTNKGLIYQLYDDYETAYALYLEAEKLFLVSENYNRLINLYGKMSNIFLRNSNFERNKQIIQKTKEIIDKVTDFDAIVDYCIYQSSVCFYDGDYKGSADYHRKALDILSQTQNQHQLHTLYYNMGLFARDQNRFDEAEVYYRKSLSAAEKSGNKSNICDGLYGIGILMYYQEKFNEAEIYMTKALQMAKTIQSKLLLRNTYSALSCLEYERNNFSKAFAYRDSSDHYELELVSAETQNKLNFMAVKYDLIQKESNIRDLENRTAIQQYQVTLRGTLLVSVSILIFIMSILIIIYIRYNKRKRLLSETRIKQLEQEKQLAATQAVLDGETRERSRLAKDLHDGLGSMLSLVKLNMPDMKSGVVLEADDVTRFKKAINMLDESISELRRVAHHMMPESLLRYGLKASLTDFCHSTPSVEFHYFGNDQRLDSKLEILLYRATHEMINNALKHASATQINVQLVQENDRISLTVQDNGKGFDTTVKSKGMGLENVRNRVETYNGKMTLYSSSENGTEINIEIEINGKLKTENDKSNNR